jgi:hypothetical protein
MGTSPKVEVEKGIMQMALSHEVGKSVIIRRLTTDSERKCHFHSHFCNTQNSFQSAMINQLSNDVSSKSFNVELAQQTNEQNGGHHKLHNNLILEIDAGLLNIQTTSSPGFITTEMNVHNEI